jgi:hypothetical protein
MKSPSPLRIPSSPRSAGGLHDFFSEGDYWWPDPANPNGRYIQRDGMTNPDNFVEHRRALMRLSVQVPALVAAWKLTKDRRYATKAADHLRAWFIDERTRMNPNLQYAQAIHGITTGRGIGIIDTIHLVEVARAIEILKDSSALSMNDLGAITQWFKDYLAWMTTSKNGIEEREAKNNHGTCWVMQVAAFAQLTDNQELLAYCRDRFKTVLVSNQIAADGSFPRNCGGPSPMATRYSILKRWLRWLKYFQLRMTISGAFNYRTAAVWKSIWVYGALYKGQEKLAAEAGRNVRRPMAYASK